MKFNRRHFLATLFLAGGSAYYFFRGEKIRPYNPEVQLLLALAHHLYPTSPLGFGVDQIDLAAYITFVLEDQRILQEDRDYLLRGVKWVQEDAYTMFGKSFLQLSFEQKEKLLQKISQLHWGDNYLSYLLTYIFEALFAAPVYGSQSDRLAWAWSGHQPGFPLPQTKQEIAYEQ